MEPEDQYAFERILLDGPEDWAKVRVRFGGGGGESPLNKCLDLAVANHAKTLVIEFRYVDIDYRSEYSAFYSRTFADQPSMTVRLHFFGKRLDTDADVLAVPPDCDYIGYLVIRPSVLGPVGRTHLRPAPEVAPYIPTSVSDEVHLFGQNLTVWGVPFAQQDSQLGRCAHIAAWVCHYTAFLRHEVGRRTMAEFNLAGDRNKGRSMPSGGLSVPEVTRMMREFGLPSTFAKLGRPFSKSTPGIGDKKVSPSGDWRNEFLAECRRYLDSGVPIFIGTATHAFVLVGYRAVDADGDNLTFFRHDDQVGPYVPVPNAFQEIESNAQFAPWLTIIVPLPEKVWLSPAAAHNAGMTYLNDLAYQEASDTGGASVFRDADAAERISFRTYFTSANDFKRELRGRLDERLAPAFRIARFSRYIWVTEALDRQVEDASSAPSDGAPACVIGEAVIDATSSDVEPNVLLWHILGTSYIEVTGEDRLITVETPGEAPYRSGRATGEPTRSSRRAS